MFNNVNRDKINKKQQIFCHIIKMKLNTHWS